MPTKDQHISQWKRNRSLLLQNTLAAYPEWKITVAFYCALHAVESLFSFRSLPKYKDHRERNAFLANPVNKLLGLWHPYKALFDASHDARYSCPDVQRRFGIGVQKDLIQSCLQSVEEMVMKEAQIGRDEFPLLAVDALGNVSVKSSPQEPADSSA